jgi:catechol 2,3-dioxygenase-like lactoylglutathione lyase family enzyme
MTHSNDIPVAHPYREGDWAREIYPMPSFPMILASDLAASARWYQDVLGFADVFTFRGPGEVPLLAHLRWCKWADVLITQARTPVEPPRGRGITLNFSTFDVDDVAERAGAAGAKIVEGPMDRPWNARDVTIEDPDGYRLNFTGPSSRRAPGESADEVMKRAFKR